MASNTQWDGNRPYIIVNGQRQYISPSSVSPNPLYEPDERLRAWAAETKFPGNSLFKTRGTFDSRTGQIHQGTNWSNIASMAVGGLIAAPFVAPAVSGLFGPGAAPAASATGTGAGTTATVAGAPVIPAAATGAGAGTTAAATTAGVGAGVTPVVREVTRNASNGLLGSGLTVADLVNLGTGTAASIVNSRAASQAADANNAYMREALDFARRSYDEQTAKEQARWDATEARRAPYRQASLSSLEQLRKLVGV